MKLRALFLLLSLFLSLATSADRAPKNCSDAWTPNVSTRDFPSGFGVNIHFTDPQPGEIKMIAAAGFRWVRMDFKWDATERERGVYDFSEYERLLSALDKYGIRALFILDYGNTLYEGGAPPRTEIARQAFARWAIAAAKKFSGRGVIWELYNEPNIKLFWPPQPNVDEYIALALTVGRAFRNAAPNEKLIGPATSGIDFLFLESCFKAGLLDYWSGVSVHPYLRSDPENAANEYCRLREMIDRYKIPTGQDRDRTIPIISSEWGCSSVWRGLGEDKQSEVLAREFLTNAANGVPISIWYDWHDDGTDAGEAEHHFGVVRHAYQADREQIYDPKPAYATARTLLHSIAGYTFQKRVDVKNESDYVLIFAKAGDVRIVAWTTTTGHRITIPFASPQVTIIQHTGGIAGPFSTSRGAVSIEISSAPVYLSTK
jgi:hypothetical protein